MIWDPAPYTPALGAWVVTVDGAVGRVVAISVTGYSAALDPSPLGMTRIYGPWDRPGTTWLPGWAGRYGWASTWGMRPVSPEELAAYQLDQLQAGGL